MTRFKKFLALAGTLAVLAVSAPVSANTYNLGTVNASEGKSLLGITLISSFDDVFQFVLGAGSGINASVLGWNFSGPVPSLKFALVARDATVGSWITLSAIAPDPLAFSAANTFGALALNTPYDLHVASDATIGWGVYSITVTPVPEPGTWALLFAGLGLMGTIIRRRNSQNND